MAELMVRPDALRVRLAAALKAWEELDSRETSYTMRHAAEQHYLTLLTLARAAKVVV